MRERPLASYKRGFSCAVESVRGLLSSYEMKSKLIVALLFSSATAVAGPHDELSAARLNVQAVSARVSYHEKQTIIAERDIATARIHQNTATKGRSEALRTHDSAAASDWARRYDDATKAEREAQARADRSRSETDAAREELEASNARVRQLERVATRASR